MFPVTSSVAPGLFVPIPIFPSTDEIDVGPMRIFPSTDEITPGGVRRVLEGAGSAIPDVIAPESEEALIAQKILSVGDQHIERH